VSHSKSLTILTHTMGGALSNFLHHEHVGEPLEATNNKLIKAFSDKFKPLCDTLDVVMADFKYYVGTASDWYCSMRISQQYHRAEVILKESKPRGTTISSTTTRIF